MDSAHAALVAEDVELINRARKGDAEAFGELYGRHNDAARRVAASCVAGTAAQEDLVAEAFARIWALFQRGAGPETHFRAYLFTSIRNIAMRRPAPTVQPTPWDEEAWASMTMETLVPDPSSSVLERDLMRAAFDTLPDRWRAVLWHLEVEQMEARDVGQLLGLAPNAVASLAYRAREGLAQAYLQQQVAPAEGECGQTRERLGAHARNALPERAAIQVRDHLATCPACSEIHDNAKNVNRWLRSLLLPAAVGLPVAGGLSGTGVGASSVGSASQGAGAGVGATSAGASSQGAGTGVGATSHAGGLVSAPTQGAGKLAAVKVGGGKAAVAAKVGVGGATKFGITAVVIAAVTVGSVVGATRLARKTEPAPSSAAVSAPAVIVARTTPTPQPLPTQAETAVLVDDAMDVRFAAWGPLDAQIVGIDVPDCAAPTCASQPVILDLPQGATVDYALLQWAAAAPGESWRDVTLAGPTGSTPVTAFADRSLDDGAGLASADVTEVVAAGGNGSWRLDGVARGTSRWAAWALLVVYSSADLPDNRLAVVHEGALRVSSAERKVAPLDLAASRATRLGVITWGDEPGLDDDRMWTIDSSVQGSVLQRLEVTASEGQEVEQGIGLTMREGVSFPTKDGERGVEALSFDAGADHAAPFGVGAIVTISTPD
ncbi:MAG: sigma-70 family RNA polymerase sigma factor [Micrococcales bacterium]|nr:sigma-70 family RNA polymerase sigma factor [Micrococcales bacterium]